MHRTVAPYFESIEEALQYHSNRPASARKIPVIWGILDKDPTTTNKSIVKILADRGLFADGTLIGEIRRSIRRVKGMPARKSRKSSSTGRVVNASPKKKVALEADHSKTSMPKFPFDSREIPVSVYQSIEHPIANLVMAMRVHGLSEITLSSSSGFTIKYSNTEPTGGVCALQNNN